MQTAHVTPSILPRLRTWPDPPEPLPAPVMPWSVRSPLVRDPATFYQPLVLAFAPPGCSFEAARWPLAQGLQAVVDVGVGYAAAAAALACALLGHKGLANAYVDNHAYHVVVAISVTCFVLSLGISASMILFVSGR